MAKKKYYCASGPSHELHMDRQELKGLVGTLTNMTFSTLSSHLSKSHPIDDARPKHDFALYASPKSIMCMPMPTSAV